jgi:hypothetical protein
MALLKPYVDIEKAMMALLDRDLPELSERSGTELPDDLTDLPYARIERLPGRRSLLVDAPVVDVDVFAVGTAGKSLQEAIEAVLASYPRGVAVGDRFVKLELVSSTGPRRLPWSDDRVRRYAATYQLRARRP